MGPGAVVRSTPRRDGPGGVLGAEPLGLLPTTRYSSDASALPRGEPRPAQAFHPAVATKPSLLPCTMLVSAVGLAYSTGLISPHGRPLDWLINATRPAHSGATALVPPITRLSPSTRTR